ncbi:hypothetical protein Glove_402g23 [Diversispora epigaea]|uniref:Uncharacterized protein n=1 Tax=Diversispora epigaea TaxID=1348612 RepID=A0A397GZA4_9GLOM|nr:hypothetical protein Glove_402g23 [Diversispora epigaea]
MGNAFQTSILIAILYYDGVVLKGINGQILIYIKRLILPEDLCRKIITRISNGIRIRYILSRIRIRYRSTRATSNPFMEEIQITANSGSIQEGIMRIVLKEVWYYEDPYIVIPEHLRELVNPSESARSKSDSRSFSLGHQLTASVANQNKAREYRFSDAYLIKKGCSALPTHKNASQRLSICAYITSNRT